MAEDNYNRKLSDLQKHIPFMENMIAQLKDPKWKPREAQLNKMESLYSMITDRNKKWKYETLLKCEEVILKLQSKVKGNRTVFQSSEKKEQFMNPERPEPLSNAVSDIMNALKFSTARAKLNSEIMCTPKSPSPVKEVIPQHAPKIIPFEATNEPIRKSTNIVDPNELSVTWNTESQDRYINEKPDIYTSAAKSLGVIPPTTKVSIFDRLGPVVPEATEKPLLSDADLEMLRTGDDFVVICHNDRQNQHENKEKSLTDISLKVTPKLAPVPASKPKISLNENSTSSVKEEKAVKPVKKVEASKEELKVKNKESSSKSKSSKSDKIVTADIFGSCLSSIDNMILEDSKKKDKKKEERRHSSEHKKESSTKQGHESKHHHHHHKHKSKDKDKDKEKDKERDKDANKEHKIKKENQIKASLIKCEDKKSIKESAGPVTLERMAEKIIGNKERVPEIPMTSPVPEKEVEKPKRLADKYNPKPRKHTEFDTNQALERNQTESTNFEIRDPRRRPVGLLPTPPSILGSPPFQTPALPNMTLPINANIPTTPNIPLVPAFIPRTVQQPTISPTQPMPLLQLNFQPPQDFQVPWVNDAQDFQRPVVPNSVFEPPPKFVDPRRGNFHQEGVQERPADPRRQPRFSPPPTIAPVHAPQFGTGFVNNNIYVNQNNLSYVPPVQRGMFEPPSTAQQGRFEPPPASRFDTPLPNSQANQSNANRKSFCPFEPLESSREETQHHNQGFFQKNHGFRNSFGQYNNNRTERFDRYGRKLPRDDGKPLQRSDTFNKDKFRPPFKEESFKDRLAKPDEDVKSRSGSENDHNQKELTHTKYDEIYSKLDIEKETFSSPLESLYCNAKTAVKSSIQSFKIPKKPKPEASAPPPVIEEPKKEVKIKVEPEKDSPKVRKSKNKSKSCIKSPPHESSQSPKEPEEKEAEIESKPSNASEDLSGNESDDIPIGKRIKRRSMILNKKILIEDSDDDSILDQDDSKVTEEEEEQEDETSRPKRSTRQSAIKANKLIRKRSTIVKAKKKVTRTKIREDTADIEEKLTEEVVEKSKSEEPTIKDEKPIKTEPVNEELPPSEIVKEEPVKAEEKDVGIKLEEKPIIEKEPDEVQKAKEELITEAKKKNLNLNDQGAEVLQFILMNYKKIKKIFKSDSSSDEDEKSKKKKKKKREKSHSSDEDTEKSDKEDNKPKENKVVVEENVDKVERDTEEKVDDKTKAEKKEIKEDEAKSDSEPKEEAKKESSEEVVEDAKPIDTEPKASAKQSGRKVRKVIARKGNMVRRKLQGRITRNQASRSPAKKARRSELDKLHDDIKEMLMGGEVLTSTGKRSCTIPKEDTDESKRSETTEEPSTSSLDQNIPVVPAKGTHLRVLIEKTDIQKLLTKENVSKDSDDTSPELEGPPKLEKMVTTPTKVARKKILRKKKHRWASGFLRRKNKPKNSTGDEKDDTETVSGTIKTEKTKNELHSKDYYVDGPKNQCKLCSFRGKLAIQHYKSNHPKSEVLISRMDPKTTEHLIREARDKRYDLIELTEKPSTKKLRYGFKCPFKCLIGTTVDTFENYYDHITCHTGEHRYFCPFCNFSTFSPRNLRAHMVPQHNSNLEHYGKPATPAPPSSKYMFGFICKECHYVQINREKLESHVRDHHGNDAEIIKINLSLICQEQNDAGFSLESCGDNNLVLQSQKKQEHINECIENVVNGAGSIRSPEPSMVKDLNIFDLMSQIEAEEPPPVLVKVEPLELEPDIDALVPEIQLEEPLIEKPKDPDLTVFMCRSDLPPVDDEETIEQRRLKKMNEIHENFKPSRTSIVDKLQRMLETAKENDSRVPTPPAPVSSPAFSRSPILIPLERSKKSLDTIAKNLLTTEVSLSPKNVAPISSIINRLQDKLLPIPGTSSRGIGGSDSAPNSATSSPTRESISSTDQSFCNLIPTLTIGPISICFDRNNEVLYSCLVPHCVFNTISSHVFEMHCKTMHQDFVYGQTKCNLCNIKIDHEDTCVSMHDIYRHICTCHKDFFESEATIPIFTEDSQETVSLPENFEEILNTEQVILEEDQSGFAIENPSILQSENQTGTLYPFKIADAAILKDGSKQNAEPEGGKDIGKQYSFVITSVTSVEQSKEEDKKKKVGFSLPHKVPNVISQANHGNGPKFPFIITNVTSLAKKPLANKTYFTTTPSSIPQSPISQIVVSSSPVALNSTRAEAVSTNSLLSIPPLIAVQSVSGIQTSPAIKTYTIPSTATTSAIVPIILNPLAPENERTQLQLPVISSIQSLAPVRKDIIRPVPLNQLTSNIMSSAEKPELPEVPQDVIALVGSEGTAVTLNDIPLTKQECLVRRKTATALMNMLSADVVNRFYKCPVPACSFTNDKAPNFAKHLGTHTAHVGSMYVPCLHCDFKMPFKMYMVHLEVRHNKCEYGCGKCLYRATNADFVIAHNRMKHAGEPIVVKTPRENMPARIPGAKLISIKSILKPYVCTRLGCNMKTVFSDVFFQHVATQHSKTPSEHCFKPNSHTSVSGIYLYHCRYCTMGNNNLEVVVNHQALVHARMDYCIVQRKFVPNPNFPEKTGLSYSPDDDSTYDRLYFIYGDSNAATPTVTKSISNGPNATESLFLINQSNENPNNVFVDVDQSQNSEGTAESAFDSLLNEVNMVEFSEIASGDEPEIPILNSDLDEVDPLSFDNNRDDPIDNNFSDGFDSNDERIGENETTGTYDLKATKYTEEYSGVNLFKCVCGSGFEDRFKFKQHVTVCQANKTLKCAHCGVIRKNVRNLLTHLNEHGRKRFKCSLCQFKHSSKRFVKDHMNLEHNVLEMMILPAKMSKKVDYHKDDFVLRPKLSPVKRIANVGVALETPNPNKILFSPNEMKQLPRPPIYVTDVFCAVCNYATKVKSNMVRHLQAHQNEQAVPQTAPVNPVPCLEKSEKMFDKMVNLALSSHSGGRMGGGNAKTEKIDENDVPAFVPINKRFVCGAQSCTYLCPEESMLRRHLTTFHSLDLNYTCLHCNSKLFEDKVINVDTILKHLKLHDNHLYGCGNCKFIHNLKHKVERHLSDKHPEKSSALVVIREMGKEIDSEGAVSAEKEELKKPWRCGMCKFRCADIEEVKNHTKVKHNVSAKQKCALCEFGSEEMMSLLKHFELDHNGQPVDIIVSYYKEDEVQQKPDTDSEFNTTPLWQRNKSIKHIRGILLDDTNNKIPKTIGPKKTKAWKAKKQENETAKATKVDSVQDVKKDAISSTGSVTKKAILTVKKDVIAESNKRPIALTFDTPKGVDAKRPSPKRRKSKLENKIASVYQKDEATPKTNDNDVIFISNSDEDNGEAIDVINVDEILETKKNEPLKAKQNITVLSDHRLNTNVESDKPNKVDEMNSGLKSKIILISQRSTDVDSPETLVKPPNMTLMPKIVDVTSLSSTIIEIADERPEDLQILDDTSIPTEKIDISNSVEKEPVVEDNLDDVVEIINDDKVIDTRTRSLEDSLATIIKINSPAPVLNEYPQITLEDSSTEDSDVVEVVPSNDVSCNQAQIEEVPKEAEVPNSEIAVDEPKDNVEIPEAPGLKNVKLVNVCSIRDTYNRDAEESSECGESESYEVVENVENLQDVEEEIPPKKSKLDLTISDIEAMTKSELLNGNFVGTYGPYGFPWGGKYKCPLCEKYMSVSKIDFVSHIYEELQYGMYKCTACGFTDSDKIIVKDHHKLSHKDIQTEERVILNLDLQIVDWVDKLTAFQTRILTLDKEDLQETHFYCYFCEYRCAAQSDMRKHQVRHWTSPPYTCAICNYKGIQRSVVVRHIARYHPKASVVVNELDVGDEVIIKRVRMTWRSDKHQDAPKTLETLETEGDVDFNLEDLKDAFLNCSYCPYREKLDSLKKHCAEKHPNLKLKAFRYRCNYCASTFLAQKSVEQHFKLCHIGMRHSYSTACSAQRRFTCTECSVSEDKLITIEEHLRSHFKMIKCLYCGLRTVYWKTMKRHHNEKHRGETYEFSYLISEEKKYEEALTKVKETSNCVTGNSRKRKRPEDDILLLEDDLNVTSSKDKVRQVARKSTGTRMMFKEPESHYGKEPSTEDFANIITTVDVMGAPVTMNIIKLSKILNISPSVVLEDCESTL